MLLFIDCEFNSAEGGLISMALVGEDPSRHFYEVVDCTEAIDPWVKDNVMPYLEKEPIRFVEFQRRLKSFLKQFARPHIVADHPNDIARFCQAITISGGEWMGIQPLQLSIDDRLSAKASTVPHNAFHDAVAIRNSWFKLIDSV